MSISNSTFTGVKWDGEAIEAVNIVARALSNMTELFKSQNIAIECLLKIEQPHSADILEDEIEDNLDDWDE